MNNKSPKKILKGMPKIKTFIPGIAFASNPKMMFEIKMMMTKGAAIRKPITNEYCKASTRIENVFTEKKLRPKGMSLKE